MITTIREGRVLVLVLATVVTGLFAGFFWTYTVSVPAGLGALDDETYVAAFQSINATIRNAPFGVVFFGTVPAVALALVANLGVSRYRTALLTGALVLTGAVVLVTATQHLPLNDALATAAPADASAARAAFEATWNRWNLVRTGLATGALVCLATARLSARADDVA